MKLKLKKLTALILSALILVSAAPLAKIGFSITAAAEGALSASGQCGKSVSWSFGSETGVLTISGTGAMDNYTSGKSPFYANEDIRQVVVEQGVSSIGDYAFEECMALRTVRISNSVASAGENAFDFCFEMRDVYFDGTSSEWKSFTAADGNYYLESAKIHYLSGSSEKLYGPLTYKESDGKAVITYCDKSLSGAYSIPSEIGGLPVAEISGSSFASCAFITEINIAGSVKTVGSLAFSKCEQLKSVSLGEGVQEIKDKAFSDCTALETVSLPSTLETLGNSVFSGCTCLKDISAGSASQHFTSDNGVLYTKDYSELIIYPAAKTAENYTVNANTEIIRNYAFSCAGRLVTLDAASTKLKTIGVRAFENCYSLKSAAFPVTVSEIGECAFDNTAVTEVAAGENLTEIKEGTYNMCSLETAVIPDSVTVCDKGFSNATAQEYVIGSGLNGSNDLSLFVTGKFTVSKDNKYFSSDAYGVLFNKDKTVLIRFPVLSDIEKYEIPDTVTEIGRDAFSASESPEMLAVPTSVQTIGDNAFYYSEIGSICYKGTEDEWNSIEISKSAFLGSEELQRYNEYGKDSGTCGENLTWSFNSSTNSLVISGSGAMDSNASFNDYGWYSFKDRIEYVEAADGVTSIGANAFAGCTALGEIYLGRGVKAIGENAFAGCTALTLVTLMADGFTAENAFSSVNANLTVIAPKDNAASADFASEKDAQLITVDYYTQEDETVLAFNGGTTVYQGFSYNYLTNILAEYPEADNLFFDRLVFDGVSASELDGVIDEDTEISADASSDYLTFNNLYIVLRIVRGDTEEKITFGRFLELLESGNLDAFKLDISSDEPESQGFFEKLFNDIADGVDRFVIRALNLMSKVVNFIVGIFKKK